MRIMRVLVLLCIGLATIGLPSARPSAAQEEPNAPYLYYESPLQHGVIVERADGTDAHLLGGVVMPEDHRIIIGPQFSADGQWVAWTSRGDSAGDTKLYVVRVDGTAQVQTVENLNRVNRLLWSPLYDYLAIVRSTRAGNSSGAEQEYEILLVDTQFGDIITRQMQAADAIEEIAWSGDSETFSVYYSVRVSQDYNVPPKYKRLDMELDDDFSRTDVTPEACEQPHFTFPHATTVDLQNHQLHLDNPAGEPVAVDLPVGYFQMLSWSPDGQQLVVWMRDECEVSPSEAAFHAWYYRVGDEAFQEIASNLVWDTYSGPALWSGDSEYAALMGWDAQVYVVATTSLPIEITLVPMPTVFDSAYATFQWTLDQTLYLQSAYGGSLLYALPVGALKFTEVPNLPDYPDRVSFSADGRYMTFAADCPNAGENVIGAACVVDRQSNTTAVVYPHGGSGTLGYDFKEIYWHPTNSDWLIIVNGGGAGGGEQFIQVANAEGTLRRELTSCVYVDCYGWVSDNIVIDSIPPFEAMLSIPRLTLTGMQDFLTKAEWNPDGSKIAVSAMDGTTHVFDTTTGQVLYTVTGHVFDWSPDGATLATIDRQLIENGDDYIIMPNEGPIVLYDAMTGQSLSTIEGSYFNLDYSPDGQYLAAGSQLHNVAIIEVASGATVYTTEFSAAVAAVAFSPDGQRLAIGGVGNEVWVWDYAGTSSPQTLTFTNQLYFYGIFAFDWKPDGTQLMGSGGPGMFFFGNNSVIFDLASEDSTIIPNATYATYTSDGGYIAHVDEYNGSLEIIGADDHETAFRLYVSGWWIDFDPAMSQILVAESFMVTIWQLP